MTGIKIKNMFAPKEADDGMRILICEDVQGAYPYPTPAGWKYDEMVDVYIRNLKPPFMAEFARLNGGLSAKAHNMTADAYFLQNCREHFSIPRPERADIPAMLKLIGGYAEGHNVTLMCWCPDLSVCHVGIVKEAIIALHERLA